MTLQFTQSKFVDYYEPTIEDCYRKTLEVDNKICVLDILDTAGQEEYSVLRDQYMKNGEGFLMVFSITDKLSFEEIKNFHQRIYRLNEHKDKVPMVVCGNKCDLEEKREIQRTAIETIAKEYECPWFETSAKENKNVVEAFQEVVREIRKLNCPQAAEKEVESSGSGIKRRRRLTGKLQNRCLLF
eukprot:CAMPEP_0174256296 /NCGR_PEP_ID=MMETSP0439-20130205/5550_1 /TAXON_ID=0 /ORGANISM="Stereomyxa ramosa, Strain Chinc5" /LENGTH=184 /DNA_ID=CAMNT_0015338843 /DNA_START=102 /DNA_END=656 /DNA_ORIENTATION=+